MKHLSIKIATVFMLFVLVTGFAVAAGQAEGGEEVQEVVFADASWDSILVHNRIAAFILENGYGGYEADFIPGDTIPLFNGLASGDIDVNMESWHSNFPEAYEEEIEAETIVNLGENFPDGPQGWWVPPLPHRGATRTEASRPRLPGWSRSRTSPSTPSSSPTPENPGKGRILVGPPGWAATERSENLMEEYGLYEDFTAFLPGSGAALAASMKSAYEQGEPWIGYYWEPTAIMYQLDMVRLEGTEWPPAEVDILMNAKSYEEMPEVAEFLSEYSTTVAINNEFLNALDTQVDDAEEAAIWFLQNREDVWTGWVSDEVADNVRAALPQD